MKASCSLRVLLLAILLSTVAHTLSPLSSNSAKAADSHRPALNPSPSSRHDATERQSYHASRSLLAFWQPVTALPAPRAELRAATDGSHIFVTGGSTGFPVHADVYTAAINSDGTLGSWSSSTPLPSSRCGHASVVSHGHLFVIGGYHRPFDPGGGQDTVFSAPIDTNGRVGAWTSVTPLPRDLYRAAAVAFGDWIYVLGGWSDDWGSAWSGVLRSEVAADGTIGDWVSLPSLPYALHAHGAAVINDFVFVIGGLSGLTDSTLKSSVYAAELHADGSIGAWTQATSLPTTLHSMAVVTFENLLVVMGGRTRATWNDTERVYSATVAAAGTLSEWKPDVALPRPLFFHVAVAGSSSVYVIGGGNESAGLPDVYAANHLAGGALRLPFSIFNQTGTCESRQNGLNCVNSYFDHYRPDYGLSEDGRGRLERFFGGQLTGPIGGDATRCLDYPDDPVHGCTPCNISDGSCYDGHDAYDFGLVVPVDPNSPPLGSRVLAAAAGTVTDISQPDVCNSANWRGTALHIDHGGGYATEYWHLSRAVVTSGHVEAGDRIGVVGSTGCSEGVHLHFALYYEDHVADPYGWRRSDPDPYLASGHGACFWTAGCSTQGSATESGGAVISDRGDMIVIVPPGAVTGTITLELALARDPEAQPSAVPTGYSFDAFARDTYGNAVETFLTPLTIGIGYVDLILDYVVENTLTVHRWDEGVQSWVPLPTTLFLEDNQVVATTDHLSRFALLGEPLNPAPEITSISPTSSYAHLGLDAHVIIEGSGFLPTPSVRLGVSGLAVTSVDSNTIDGVLLSGLDPGVYTLTVTNPDGQEASIESAYTVEEPPRIYVPLTFKNY